jgi:hypothetical protein
VDVFGRIIDIMRRDDLNVSPVRATTSLAFNENDFQNLVAYAGEFNLLDYLDFLVGYAICQSGNDGLNLSKFLLSGAIHELVASRVDSCVSILRKIFSLDSHQVSSSDYFSAVKYLLYLSKDKKEYDNYYFQGVQNYVVHPDVIDIGIFENKIYQALLVGDHDKALALSNLILELVKEPPFELQIQFLRIYFLRVHSINNAEEIIIESDKFKKFAYQIKKEDLSLTHFGEDEAEELTKRIDELLVQVNSQNTTVKTFRRGGRKYGRNEKLKVKYQNGKTIEKKFKLIESDIKNGLCEIV